MVETKKEAKYRVIVKNLADNKCRVISIYGTKLNFENFLKNLNKKIKEIK